jgi:hypothetical protein
VSEQPPPEREPVPLEYHDPRDDHEEFALLKMGGGCLLTILVVWLAIFAFALLFEELKAGVAAGVAALIFFALYAALQHRRGRARWVVAGIWIGSALGLLLTGFCGTVR